MSYGFHKDHSQGLYQSVCSSADNRRPQRGGLRVVQFQQRSDRARPICSGVMIAASSLSSRSRSSAWRCHLSGLAGVDAESLPCWCCACGAEPAEAGALRRRYPPPSVLRGFAEGAGAASAEEVFEGEQERVAAPLEVSALLASGEGCWVAVSVLLSLDGRVQILFLALDPFPKAIRQLTAS